MYGTVFVFVVELYCGEDQFVIRASLAGGLLKNIYLLLLLLFTMTIMSAEEDTELRDLVAQTLEANGVLGKIRVNLTSLTC